MSYTTEVVVPPSPNWYTSHVSDVSSDGALFAYAAHSFLVVIDVRSGRVAHQLGGHKSRVTSLAFIASDDRMRHFLVSGSADKTLILWDALTGRPIHAMSGHRSEIRAIATFRGRGGLEIPPERRPPAAFVGDFVSVDKSGMVFHWDACNPGKPLIKNQISSSSFSGALCTFDCPNLRNDRNQWHFASPREGEAEAEPEAGAGAALVRNCLCFGTQDGSVSILDVETNRVVQSWKAHVREVCHVTSLWKEAANALVLVTTSKNGEARVHVAPRRPHQDEEGSRLDVFKPVAVLSPNQKLSSGEEFRNWTSALLLPGDVIRVLVTNLKGQVWEWISSHGGASVLGDKPLHCHHNRPVFRLAGCPDRALLSCGMDRQAACFDGEGSLRWTHRGFGAHAQAVAVSKGTKMVAVGCGDNTIRMYGETGWGEAGGIGSMEVSKRKALVNEKKFMWNGLQKLKFSEILFHPNLDHIIVFASEGGDCVGVYDIGCDRVTFVSSRKMGIVHMEFRSEACETISADGGAPEGPCTLLTLDSSGRVLSWHKEVRQWGDMHTSKLCHPLAFLPLPSPCAPGGHQKTRLGQNGHHSDPVTIRAFALCPTGRYLVVATNDNEILVCAEDPSIFGGGSERAGTKRLARSSWYIIASVGGPGEGEAWDSKITCLGAACFGPGQEGGTRSMRVLAGCEDGSIHHARLPLDLGGSEATSNFRGNLTSIPQAHKTGIKSIVMDPINHRWASIAQGDGIVKVWYGTKSGGGENGGGEDEDGSAWKREFASIDLQGHHAGVLSVCWSGLNADCIYSVSEDQAMRLWHIMV